MAIFNTLFLYYRYGRINVSNMTAGEVLFYYFLPWGLCILLFVYMYCVWNEIKIQYLFRYLKPLDDRYKKVIIEKFRYYHRLPLDKRKLFLNRVNHFLINKKFYAHDGDFTITDEMKALIASSCVQITFGLKPIFLSHFKNIRIALEPINWEKYLVRDKQVIIPWYDFIDGYDNPEDAYNPGLEIMSMALVMEDRLGKKAGSILGPTVYRVWKQKSSIYANELKNNSTTSYYSSNKNEQLFAISVVSFFEQSESFRASYPDLYDVMVRMLKQNPLKYKRL